MVPTAAFGMTASIPIPTSFFPGATPVGRLAAVISDRRMIARILYSYVFKLVSCLIRSLILRGSGMRAEAETFLSSQL